MADIHWVALSLVRNIGGKTLAALVAHFGSAQAVFQATADELLAVRGVGHSTAKLIGQIDLETVRSEIQMWQAAGVRLLLSNAPDYPPVLSQLDDAPPILFVRGDYQPEQWAKAVAIVGTRKPSAEAHNIALQLGQNLAAQGWLIVSGLALGVDAAAHDGALAVEQGHTLAVTGSGVLNLYPPQNRNLAQRILAHGAILSENHPHATPNAARLIARNRIITGLCQHVIIVESAVDGGAMYAARAAQTQGRILHAVGLPASGNLQLLAERASYIGPDLQHVALD